jgi:hypothetical protein
MFQSHAAMGRCNRTQKKSDETIKLMSELNEFPAVPMSGIFASLQHAMGCQVENHNRP